VGAGVWMWWTDGLRSDYGRVGAAAVCKHGEGWKAFRSHLSTGRVEVYDAELCNRTRTPGVSKEEGHTADTWSGEGSCLQRLASGDLTNGAPGTWARAASSQVD
jgi:hypothetical protein